MEKRSRDIQFSKVGIEVSRNDQQLNKACTYIARHENHLESPDISSRHQLSIKIDEDHPLTEEGEVSLQDNGTIVPKQGEVFSSLPDEVENVSTVMLEDERGLSCITCIDGGLKKPEMMVCYGFICG